MGDSSAAGGIGRIAAAAAGLTGSGASRIFKTRDVGLTVRKPTDSAAKDHLLIFCIF
jgi:hypothetical protein